MKMIKGAVFTLLVLLVLVGVTYVYAGSSGSYESSGASVSVITGKTRDFERNIYVVEAKQEGKITYSVVQSKAMKAGLDGITPSHVLAKQGDTVKLAIDSDVNCNFMIGGYNVRARTQKDTTTEVQFNADLAGIYPYMCERFLEQEVGFIEVVK